MFANDIDKRACQVYRYHYGNGELVEGDIHNIPTSSIPDHDLLVGGFPCQPFSVAGKREGLRDPRGTLFHEIARIAMAKKPTFLLLENVKGLLSNDNGKTFATILETLGNIGYWCEWQVINSRHHNVPQNRERVYIIGHFRGKSSREIFRFEEVTELHFNIYTKGKKQLQDKRETFILQQFSHSGTNGKGRGFRLYENIMPTLTGQMGTGGNNVPLVFASTAKQILLDNLGGNIKNRIHDADVAWTLGGSKTGIIINNQIRKLTPTECERLQAFPDNWTEKGLTFDGKEVIIPDTHRYRLLGNAVTTSVITYIGKLMSPHFA